ncbi:Ankyrin repeat, bromo and BTB domain-containing protein [Gracilariopsis chorda]|uniref:Ankyrin repeat, bromo and BTB domain-containing protein n=1 Tax=Gracilariopsis chorda TaxID=448386 RepID=A0A2V3IVA3_9FLOR|nr:Ankyrin repeat, bromo and BTB domain-containing protein [Gracilariopsis chorda]|eukprot:PXF45637.1 Ankyrin repeat, bromo and BTB domain-containing protein [Gracilariopsis chorda]
MGRSKARRSTSGTSVSPTAAVPDEEEELIDHGNGKALESTPSANRPNKKRKRETVLSSPRAVRSTSEYAFYEGMLFELMQNAECTDFLEPVLTLWSPQDVPGYLDKIKHPMDLGTVKKHMQNGKYILHDKKTDGYSFDSKAMAKDLRLIFQNCMEYNEPSSPLYNTAKKQLEDINSQILENEAHINREKEKERREIERKRENERKRRKAAEEEAALAASQAKKAALALEKAKKEAREAERRRQEELKRKDAEWAARLKQEKARAVQEALDELLAKQRRDRRGSVVNTSSVSSDDNDGGIGEVSFTFVSTEGMEKKRGRKSAVVMELEVQHDDLMKRRKAILERAAELEKMKSIEMSFEEKRELCNMVGQLDFVRMKAVVDIIVNGMGRADLLHDVEVDLEVNKINKDVLREIQFFLQNPAAHTARDALRHIELKITDIETRLVEIRYQKIS